MEGTHAGQEDLPRRNQGLHGDLGTSDLATSVYSFSVTYGCHSINFLPQGYFLTPLGRTPLF